MNIDKTIRVALCISGQPRFHNGKSYESLKREILDKYNTDVFIHSWISSDRNFEYPYAKWSKISNGVKIDPSAANDLINLYNPKLIETEQPRIFEQFCKRDDYLSNNMPSMFYSIKKCDDLRKAYGPYDFVVRARTDTLLSSPLPDFNILDRNTVYVPDNCGNPMLLNDNFSISGGHVADRVYNIFDNLWEYSEHGRDYSPEKMWTFHLYKNKIRVQKMNITQDFVRSND